MGVQGPGVGAALHVGGGAPCGPVSAMPGPSPPPTAATAAGRPKQRAYKGAAAQRTDAPRHGRPAVVRLARFAWHPSPFPAPPFTTGAVCGAMAARAMAAAIVVVAAAVGAGGASRAGASDGGPLITVVDRHSLVRWPAPMRDFPCTSGMGRRPCMLQELTSVCVVPARIRVASCWHCFNRY